MPNPYRISTALACVAVMISIGLGVAVGAPTILLDLPRSGPLGEAVTYAAAHLDLQGYGVLELTEPQPTAPDEIVALATMSGTATATQAADRLIQAVREGAGLVYLVASDVTHIEQDARLLAAFGLQLTYAPGRPAERFRLLRHEILEDVRQLKALAVPIRLSGSKPTVLIQQGDEAIAVAATFGQGRIVVLPADLLGTHQPYQQPPVDEVRLLAQAMHWAAGSVMAQKAYASGSRPRPSGGTAEEKLEGKKPHSQPPSPDVQQPNQGQSDHGMIQPPSGTQAPAPSLPTAVHTLSSTVIWDMGGEDDRWPQVSEVVRGVVDAAGLEMREVRVREGREAEPLVTRMPGSPSLLVIGSHRDFSIAEAEAVGAHVRSGGALLAVANATSSRQSRMVSFNRILSEFGLAVRLTRLGGRAQVADLPLTRLVSLRDLPPGISVWGFNDWKLISAAGESAASAQVYQNGRVVVLDGTLLVASDHRVAAETRQLLTNALWWLTGRE